MVCRNQLRQPSAPANARIAAGHRTAATRVSATTRGRLSGWTTSPCGSAVIDKYKMAKHFHLQISDDSFTYRRNAEAIEAEAALDGLYIVRTSLAANWMPRRRCGLTRA